MRQSAIRFVLGAWLLAALLIGATLPAAAAEGGTKYLSYNVWYEKPARVWSTNYQKGAIIPAGTPVSVTKVRKNKSVTFTDDKGTAFTIVWVPKHHPGLSFDDFRARLFGDKPLEELTKGFTEDEKKAVQSGKVSTGMSRAAVLVTVGYPPEIQTPSLEGNVWKYWANRFNTYNLEFADGKVKSIVD